jgi:hypothetical protein
MSDHVTVLIVGSIAAAGGAEAALKQVKVDKARHDG